MIRKLTISLMLCIFVLFTYTVATEDIAGDITKKCEFLTTKGSGSFRDESLKTEWIPKNNSGSIYIQFPAEGAGYVQTEWKIAPESGCCYVEYDFDKNKICETKTQGLLCETVHLQENAAYFEIRVGQKKQGVCRVHVYEKGMLKWKVQDWDPPYEKCDLMVISTHQDDEWLWFGGIIPYYQYVQDKDVQVVYMANCGRRRYGEALNGLWVGGVRHFPVFLGLKDENIDSMDATISDWGGKKKILEKLVETIRHYRPEVILTHDWNGEYGHNQHKLTSRAMQYAIEAAADASQYPESAAKYGAWQVKKLYRHLARENSIVFDWNIEYEELNGNTPFEVAKFAYSQHVSQQGSYTIYNGGKYDNRVFGLCYSVVGDDVLHKDLFENIPDDHKTDEFEMEDVNDGLWLE